ncbi:MAG: hypothetical protein ACTS8S_21905 [Giesbergeria sp.]
MHPDDLLSWRIRDRAKFQGREESEVRADIEAAREELSAAQTIWLQSRTETREFDKFGQAPEWSGYPKDRQEDVDLCSAPVRDMRRDMPIPELVEAATRDGYSYISGPLIGQDGRRKFTCSGTKEVVEAFMQHFAPAQGWTGIYGDPARGFAGAYET